MSPHWLYTKLSHVWLWGPGDSEEFWNIFETDTRYDGKFLCTNVADLWCPLF